MAQYDGSLQQPTKSTTYRRSLVSKMVSYHVGCQASTCPEAAAVTVDALHAAMVHEELCKHLLLGTHEVDKGHGVQLGFATAIRSLQGNLTAQLTAGACWARLYSQVKLTISFFCTQKYHFFLGNPCSVA